MLASRSLGFQNNWVVRARVLADGFAVLGAAGRFAVAVPLAETMIAGWLLARAGLGATDGVMTIAPARPLDRIVLSKDGTLNGRVLGVPFASDARHIAVLAEGEAGAVVALVATKDCRIDEGKTPAGDASNLVIFDRVKPLRSSRAPAGLDPAALMLMGSVTRSVQTAGALEAILSLSVAYANERVAFERPIGKFQAGAAEPRAARRRSGSGACRVRIRRRHARTGQRVR